jgi:hypothetical protein
MLTMKYNNIHPARPVSIIIVAVFLLMCSNAIAQQGYAPWSRMPSYRPVIIPHPPVQSNRPVYNPYIQNDDVRPFINFSIHFDPLLSWFSTDSYNTRNDGAIPGFNFGISYNKYFGPNYSFSSGLNIINAGGRLISREITRFELKNFSDEIITVPAGEAITYRITYLSIPLGLKLQTNQIGYGRFFTDIGLDPKIVVAGRADIPSQNIKEGNAMSELNIFNLSYHVMAGMEYPLSGNNSFILGIGFEKNLFDITRDNGDQPSNVVCQKLLSLRLGMTF